MVLNRSLFGNSVPQNRHFRIPEGVAIEWAAKVKAMRTQRQRLRNRRKKLAFKPGKGGIITPQGMGTMFAMWLRRMPVETWSAVFKLELFEEFRVIHVFTRWLSNEIGGDPVGPITGDYDDVAVRFGGECCCTPRPKFRRPPLDGVMPFSQALAE